MTFSKTAQGRISPRIGRASYWDAWVVALFVAGAPIGSHAQGASSSPSSGQPLGCLIEPERSADVGSPLVGVVNEVMVERGQAVKRGQILATLKSDVERANVEAARTRAGADAEIQAASANRDVAKLKFKRTFELHQLGFASQLEVDQAKGEFEVADQRMAQAREARQLAERELRGAEAQLRQRTVRSPFDGVIVDRLTQPGERVDGKPMFRVAALHPLRVEVIAPAAQFGQIKEGSELAVQPDFAGAEAIMAKVVQVDRLIDAASGTFRARLSLPNPKREVPAGIRCKVALKGAPDPSQAKADTPKASGVVRRDPAAASGVVSNPGATTGQKRGG